MKNKSIRIGNGAGFWGDRLSAVRPLVEDGSLDFLTLEYLSELTLAILAYQKSKDPQAGYVADFLSVLESISDLLDSKAKLKIVTNAGGLNPMACAVQVASFLKKSGLDHLSIGVVYGDHVLDQTDFLMPFESYSLSDLSLHQANAYLGAQGIVDVLDQSADIVITGRVADVSLTLGPCIYSFGWSFDDYSLLAQASVAGHLIECGAQVTGGLTCFPDSIPDPHRIGFPIAIISDNGDVVVTKTPTSGGLVNLETVTQQLLYEIGDPTCYITPDVCLDLSSVDLTFLAFNEVLVTQSKGFKPTNTYKVACSYQNGYKVSQDLVFYGSSSFDSADYAANIIEKQARDLGLEHLKYDILGQSPESVLRFYASSDHYELLSQFCRLFAPLITAGPAGVTGYTGKRSQVMSQFSFVPALINKDHVEVKSTILSIDRLLEEADVL